MGIFDELFRRNRKAHRLVHAVERQNTAYENIQINHLKLEIFETDYAPEDLPHQLPITVSLIKMIAGSDRPDYFLAKVENKILWGDEPIEYLIIAPRLVGTIIDKGVKNIALGIAYVTDSSVLDDERLSFDKCKYVAICIANEIS